MLSLTLSIGAVYFILAVTLRSKLTRDPAVAIMFGVSVLLTVAIPVVAEIAVRTHNFALLKDLLLAVGAFALAGIAFGISRSIKMSRAVKNRI